MELDKRIKIGKTYLDCFDTDTAMQFVGKKCYFGGDVTDFADISKLTCTMLHSVDNSKAPYNYYKDGFLSSAEFILPYAWVKERKAKKYRPYSLEEFKERFNIGWIMRFRGKHSHAEYALIFNGYADFHDGDEPVIVLGSNEYTLKELFEDYEWMEIGLEGYHPFGVEEQL